VKEARWLAYCNNTYKLQYPKEVAVIMLKFYQVRLFRILKVLDIEIIQSEIKETNKSTEKTDAIMFSGGDQSKIAKFIVIRRHIKFSQIVNKRTHCDCWNKCWRSNAME